MAADALIGLKFWCGFTDGPDNLAHDPGFSMTPNFALRLTYRPRCFIIGMVGVTVYPLLLVGCLLRRLSPRSFPVR